jgi:hypothetical protein
MGVVALCEVGAGEIVNLHLVRSPGPARLGLADGRTVRVYDSGVSEAFLAVF